MCIRVLYLRLRLPWLGHLVVSLFVHLFSYLVVVVVSRVISIERSFSGTRDATQSIIQTIIDRLWMDNGYQWEYLPVPLSLLHIIYQDQSFAFDSMNCERIKSKSNSWLIVWHPQLVHSASHPLSPFYFYIGNNQNMSQVNIYRWTFRKSLIW